MVNNWSKLVLDCEAVGSDKLSDRSHSGDKLGHVEGDLVENLKDSERMILGIILL